MPAGKKALNGTTTQRLKKPSVVSLMWVCCKVWRIGYHALIRTEDSRMFDALEGLLIDRGDIIEQRRLIVKGKRLNPVFHIGAPRERPNGPGQATNTPVTNPARKGKVDLIMDLMADQEVDLAVGNWTDEMGNPAAAPADADVAWTVDEEGAAFVELVANDVQGGITAGALGGLGSAIVTGTVNTNGRVVTGDFLVNVVAGLGERFEVTAGEPRERTPDA